MVFFTTQETQPARCPLCTKRVRRPIKTTPRHVWRDASVRSKSGSFLFNLDVRHILVFALRTRQQSRANASTGHVRNGRTTHTVWNVLEGRHVRRSRNVHGFIHNDVPSALAGSSGFPTDGERLLVSMASEAAIEPGNVQCGPRWRARSSALVGRPSGHAGPSAGCQGTARGFCGTIRVPISVWAICVMSWGRSGILPLSEMTLPETK